MKVEAFHNRTGQWVTLYEVEELTYSEKEFVRDFANGGHSHSSIGTVTVNRSHFSAFRIVGEKPDDRSHFSAFRIVGEKLDDGLSVPF